MGDDYENGIIARNIEVNGVKATIACDGKCSKAWGRRSRPFVRFGSGLHSIVYLPDCMLGDAPQDPGTSIDYDDKPYSGDECLNRWCYGECERKVIVGRSGIIHLPNCNLPQPDLITLELQEAYNEWLEAWTANLMRGRCTQEMIDDLLRRWRDVAIADGAILDATGGLL